MLLKVFGDKSLKFNENFYSLYIRKVTNLILKLKDEKKVEQIKRKYLFELG